MSDGAADLLPVPAAAADRAGAAQDGAETAPLRGRRSGSSRGGCGCRVGAARTPGRDARIGTIAAAADQLRVPAAAAGRAGAVPRSNAAAAETSALLARVPRRRARA
jgi:hypothetical protein